MHHLREEGLLEDVRVEHIAPPVRCINDKEAQGAGKGNAMMTVKAQA